jgi:hypothetical protein
VFLPRHKENPPMPVRVAINGFGRIGRLVLRSIVEHARRDIEVVAINDLGPVETNAHLLRYDSVHGRFPGTVTTGEDWIDVGLGKIKVTAIRNPAELPHAALNVDIALECTGLFTSREKAAEHLKAGAKRVIVSAPADGVDKTIVYGVNHETLTKDDLVISNASCTTNCLAPVARVLQDLCGIERGYMTTIHSYTGDQPTLDTLHKDLYRARAAAMSMIPTSTGAAKALRARPRRHRGRDQRRHGGRRRQGPAEGHPRGDQGPAGVGRLQPHRRLLHRRPAADTDDRRRARPGALLVRQRVGLLDADERHRRRDGEADLTAR